MKGDYSIWKCLECDIELDHEEMMKHLKEVHGIEKIKGTRKMLSHIDADTWYESTYEWEINGMKFYQLTHNKRTGEDLFLWAGM